MNEPLSFPLTDDEVETLCAALALAASRKESMARFQKHGRKHDEDAIAMRRLRFRFQLALKYREVRDAAG